MRAGLGAWGEGDEDADLGLLERGGEVREALGAGLGGGGRFR